MAAFKQLFDFQTEKDDIKHGNLLSTMMLRVYEGIFIKECNKARKEIGLQLEQRKRNSHFGFCYQHRM